MAAVRYFRKRYGMVADEACKDVSHAFFVSYDGKPYINEDVKPFPYVLQAERLPPDRARADNTTVAVKMLLAIEKAEAENLMAFSNYEEWVKMGSWEYYADNGASVYPQSTQGSPFSAASIAVTGDALTNLYEDLAAEAAIS